METRNAPPVDEDDPATPAVEVNPEKIDLQKKPRSSDVQKSSAGDYPPQQKTLDISE